jgi:hypothetical protein
MVHRAESRDRDETGGSPVEGDGRNRDRPVGRSLRRRIGPDDDRGGGERQYQETKRDRSGEQSLVSDHGFLQSIGQ